LAELYNACFQHIQGLTFGQERPDLSEHIDKYLELTACLNDNGFEVDEPTDGTLKTWLVDFRTTYEWDNSEVMQAYKESKAVEKER
jgi:hypothetical protein